MRRITTILAILVVLILRASAQTSTYCDDGCGIPWIPAAMRTINVTCNGNIYAVNYWFLYRVGCTEESEFFVTAFEVSPGFSSPPCTVDGVIAAVMQDIVQNPPAGVVAPSENDCANIWRLSTSNCWGRYEQEGKHPQMRGCNSACCWARFKVCRRNGVNTLINRITGGTLNLPGCGSPLDPSAFFECTTICSRLWDHFPGDNTGSGSKSAIGEHQTADREIASSAEILPFTTVRITFLPETDGSYAVTLFDNLGRRLATESVECRGDEAASVELPFAVQAGATLFYTVSKRGETVGSGIVRRR